jgi:hypothetical protein
VAKQAWEVGLIEPIDRDEIRSTRGLKPEDLVRHLALPLDD